MAKTKAQLKAMPAPEKISSTVKGGRVAKPTQNVKSKSKEMAKGSAAKQEYKKPAVEDTSSEDDSDVDSSDDSDSDGSDGSSGSVEKQVKRGNGVNGVNGTKAAEDSDESDESDDSNDSDETDADEDDESDESDEEEIVAAKAPASGKLNGVKKSSKNGVEASEEDESFHSADEKPVPKIKSASNAHDDDEDEDDEEDSDESDSDDEKQAQAAPVKINGTANNDEESEEGSDDSGESDDAEEQLAPKKRKAEEDDSTRVKKAKMDSLNDAQEGQNGETTNLFVGRLSWATDDDALYQEFSSFGEITGCRVVYDRDSGRSKGFGYVEFAKLSDAINAKEAKHEALFDGRNINVDYSQPRTGKPREAAPDRAKRFGDVRGAPAETIFIGNLSFDATYDIIKETFAEYGEITRISLPTDRESGQMKGFGYVSFTSVDEAKAALDSLSGVEIAGRRVRLDFATSRPGGDGGGGQSRGGGFGGGQGRGGGFGRGRGGDGWRGNSRGGRGRGGGGGGGFGARGHSTNRGGFGDYAGRKMTF